MIEKIFLKIILITNFILLSCIPVVSEYSQVQNKEYVVWVSYKKEESKLKLDAYCQNNTDQEAKLTLKIRIDKLGESGKSIINQNINVNLKKNETQLISVATLKLQESDKYTILVELLKDKKIVQASKTFLGLENEKN